MLSAAIVLPAKNEASTIGRVIRDLRHELGRIECRTAAIVVVDDSSDATPQIAAAEGATVIPGEGRGLGFAMSKGLKHSLRYDPDFVVSMDSDGQVDVRELADFLEPLRQGQADLVVGSRFRGGDHVEYRYRKRNRFGVRLLAFYIRRLTGLPITDSHGGLRAMRAEVAASLELMGSHTYVQEAIIDAHEKGYRVLELPSRWNPRAFGSSRVVASILTYAARTLPVLVVRSWRHWRQRA